MSHAGAAFATAYADENIAKEKVPENSSGGAVRLTYVQCKFINVEDVREMKNSETLIKASRQRDTSF